MGIVLRMAHGNEVPMNPLTDTLWDARDVAQYLKVSRSWVYHQAEAGLLPCLRLGGLLRFDPATIRSFAHRDIAGPSVR